MYNNNYNNNNSLAYIIKPHYYLFLALEKASFLFGVPYSEFTKMLVKPRIKVGNEYVNQGRNLQQVRGLENSKTSLPN